MECWFPTPDPDDKEGWKQWTTCHTVAAIVMAVIGLIVLLVGKAC